MKTPDTPLNEITLTAYALGELDPTEARQVESLLAGDSQARRQLDEIRAAAAQIEHALSDAPALSLSDEQRQKITAAAATATPLTITPPPSRWRLGRWTQLALAACVAIAAGLVFLPSLSHVRTRATMDPTLAALEKLEVAHLRLSSISDSRTDPADSDADGLKMSGISRPLPGSSETVVFENDKYNFAFDINSSSTNPTPATQPEPIAGLTLTTTNAYISGVPINSGTLRYVALGANSKLNTDVTITANNGNKLSDAGAVDLRGGTLEVLGAQSVAGPAPIEVAARAGKPVVAGEIVQLTDVTKNAFGGSSEKTITVGNTAGTATDLTLTSDFYKISDSPRTFSITGAGDTVIAGNVLQGSATSGYALTKVGTGSLTITGTNTHAGGTTIGNAGGMVQVANLANIGTSSTVGRDGYAASREAITGSLERSIEVPAQDKTLFLRGSNNLANTINGGLSGGDTMRLAGNNTAAAQVASPNTVALGDSNDYAKLPAQKSVDLKLYVTAPAERPLVRNPVAFDVQHKELKDLQEIRDPKPQLLQKEREQVMREQEVQEQLFRRRQLQEQWRERQGNTAEYAKINDNPFQNSLQQPLSTFSIDVDTGSYANIRRFITSGQLPPPDAVRIEEMLNYFSYYYEPPVDGKPFATHVETAGCPWNPAHQLVKIGIKGREIDRKQRPPSNLVFLLDVSGSMEPADRLPLIKSAMKLMTRELTENDKVSIVVYAGSSGLVLPCTNGANQNRILESLDRLHAGGSTNGGEGIQLAYKIAQENFIQGGVNRVILATDGDFNVGVTDRGDLIRMIEKYRQSGVFLSVLGVGTDNLKDATMEQLADKGNGVYAYLDSLREGRRVLVEQMSGTLVTIAKDVKIQVEFNPARVAGYRLIGYENRVMAAQDFNNDKKDAGDIGAGHTVTALYEIIPGPAGVQGPEGDKPKADIDELKYQKPIVIPAPQPIKAVTSSNELLTVKLRYKLPDEIVSTKIEYPVKDAGVRFEEAGKDFQFAAAVASFGMQLRNSPHRGTFTFEQAQQVAERNLSSDPQGYRAEFIELVRRVRQMIGEN